MDQIKFESEAGSPSPPPHPPRPLVPVQKHIGNATMVEVYRLKYRPHTTATAAWYAQMKESTAEWLARYQAIIDDRANRQSVA